MATKIQQKNERVNRQCVQLQQWLYNNGLRSSILKGQAVGAYYGSIAHLRQSGDIDVYVDCGMRRAMKFITEKFGSVQYDYINAHIPMYEDTEVELHWRVQMMTKLTTNFCLQNWLKIQDGEIFCQHDKIQMVAPSLKFNRFYILLHAYNHMIGEGLGFRQLMDYYFILKQDALDEFEKDELMRLFGKFGMKKFVRAVMWIMLVVFRLEKKYLLCEVDQKEGRFVLKEVMHGGNFGHHDNRMKSIGSGKWVSVTRSIQHSARLSVHYPSVFWLPIWIVFHFIWKRTVRKV